MDWRKSSKREKDYFSSNLINLEQIIKPLYTNYNPKEILRPSKIKKENFYSLIISKIDYSSSLGSSLFDKLTKQPSEDNFAGFTLPNLLKHIETQKDPRRFKEAMLRAVQLYFDGLVEQSTFRRNPQIWQEQEEALKAILSGVQLTVAGFYRHGGEVPFSSVRELVMPYERAIVTHGSGKACKGRHLAGNESQVGSYAISVADALREEKVDLVIPVASGGFEPATLTADYLGVSQMFPIRFSRVSRSDGGVLLPSQSPKRYAQQQVEGRNILVVDDIVASGKTTEEIANWLRGLNPARVYFAVVQGGADTLSDKNLHRIPSSKHLYVDHKVAV